MNEDRLLDRPLSRRRLLRFGAAAGLSAVALPSLFAACGGDDDDDDDSDATAAPSGGTTAAGETPASEATEGESDSGSGDVGDDLSGVNAEDAVATANAGGTPKTGGTLVWGMGGDADALDPHTTNAWAAWRQATFMYESLVRKDLLGQSLDVEIMPQLAESWEIAEDGLTYTFNLRQGVKFHDGTDFNAEAVIANYERNAVPDSEYYYSGAWHGSIAFAAVESVDAPDDHTVVFNMATPLIEFLAAIGDYYWFGIASPTQIKKVGNENLAANPSGTGPFVFVERVEGDHTTFARNEDYWGEKAYLDELIVRPILDDSARIVALQNGEIDLMSDPVPDLIQSLVDGGFVLSQGTTPQVAYYRFHLGNEYGQHQKVRQAINYALNRQSIATDLFRDTVIPAYGILSPGAPAYDPDWKPVEFDPERAKQLLAEAGYPDGFSAKLLAAPTASGWPLAGATAQLIQSNLRDVGIDLELELTEWVTYLSIDFRTRTDAILWGTAWGMPTNFFMNIEFESANNDEETDLGATGYNTVQNPIPDLEEMLIQAKQETDIEAANELYRQINQRVSVDDAAILAINHDKLPHLMASYVRGFVHSVNVNYDMSKVWLDK